MASEDIGNADLRALTLCMEATQIYERLGSPEGGLSIAQAVAYLACASPKAMWCTLPGKRLWPTPARADP